MFVRRCHARRAGRGERGLQACSDAGSVPFLQDELASLRQEAEAASARPAAA